MVRGRRAGWEGVRRKRKNLLRPGADARRGGESGVKKQNEPRLGSLEGPRPETCAEPCPESTMAVPHIAYIYIIYKYIRYIFYILV